MAERRLGALLDKATNPRGPDAKATNQFSDQVISAPDGPSIALRLILPKLQSTSELEATLGLKLLDTCMRSCGKRFHQEVGKFRFLNELIKLVSPKYDGGKTPESVKGEIKALLGKWAQALPKEGKIAQALQMLKNQGLVTEADIADETTVSPRPRMAPFEDRNKSALLNRLLSSKHPEDLKAANRLIQEMVRQDEYKMEKVSRRLELLETARNNVKLLHELLVHYEPNQGHDIVKELCRSCEELRPKLFKLAQEVADGDEGIGDVLHVSDELNRVLEEYRAVVERGEKVFVSRAPSAGSSEYPSTPSGTTASAAPQTPSTSSAGSQDLDLLFDVGFGSAPPPPPPATQPSGAAPSAGASLLDDELMALGLGPSEPAVPQALSQPQPTTQMGPPGPTGLGNLFGGGSLGGGHPSPQMQQRVNLYTQPLAQPSPPQPRRQIPPTFSQPPPSTAMPFNIPPPAASLGGGGGGAADLLGGLDLGLGAGAPTSQQPSSSAPPVIPQLQPPPSQQLLPQQQQQQPVAQEDPLNVLDTLFVPLESIKPGLHQPIRAYDKNGIAVVIHAGKDSPAAGVLVFVVSIMSMNPQPVANVIFQAAVPKLMRVKLQPPSVSELPGYNPVSPQGQAITQVMLIANPSAAKIRLKYKFSYAIGGGEATSDVGEVSEFPVQ